MDEVPRAGDPVAAIRDPFSCFQFWPFVRFDLTALFGGLDDSLKRLRVEETASPI